MQSLLIIVMAALALLYVNTQSFDWHRFKEDYGSELTSYVAWRIGNLDLLVSLNRFRGSWYYRTQEKIMGESTVVLHWGPGPRRGLSHYRFML